ncbi:MAG TPA: hypothetical protein PLJ52_08770 [Tenuifilaceae bacterium]|nr:hypothetical protein [Tenuifilaceae bacterium]
MARFYIGIALILFVFTGHSQVTIQGELFSPKGTKASLEASIIISPLEKPGSITAFGFSSADGKFRIAVSSPSDSILLQVKSMSVRDTILRLANKSQLLRIPVTEQHHQISEVRVANRPIFSKGDTTTYIVSSFVQRKDFSIGDVISNMPGFEVSPEGKVSYQGRDIQKYYIEGLDLLEGQYSLANKNLPHTAVGAVEVLHNHQPVKAIEGTIASDATSLNIKLKRNIAVTGTAQGSLGFSPLLWELNLTPMLFGKKQQIIASWQWNNTGNDLGSQHQALTFSNGKLDGATTLKSNFLSVPNISSPSISKNKYLFNKANLLTYNHLIKITPTTEVKVNGSYFRDNVDENQSVTTTYFLENTTIDIKEHQQNNLFRHSLIANATLTQNVKSRYLQNKVSYAQFWDSDQAELANLTTQRVKAHTPHLTFSNSLDALIPIKKNFLQVESVVDYNQSPQRINFAPAVFIPPLGYGNSTTQQVSNTNIITQNRVRFAIPIGRVVLTSSLSFDLEKQEHKTAVLNNGAVNTADSLTNKLTWQQAGLTLKEELEYKKGDFRLNLGVPMHYVGLSITDAIHSASTSTNRLFVKPTLSVKHTPFGGLTTNAFASYSESLSNPNDLTQGNVITSHRLMRSNQSEVDTRKSFLYQIGATYRNPATGLFGSISWNETFAQKNQMINQISMGDGRFIYKAENQPNNTRTGSLTTEAKWYIGSAKTTIGLKWQHGKTNLEYMLSGIIGKNTITRNTLTPSILFNKSRYWSADYAYSIAQIKVRTHQSASSIMEQQHKFSLYLYPTQSNIIGFETEYYHNQQKGQPKSESLFSNITYSYRPSDKRIGIKLQCRNIFDTNKLVSTQEMDIAIISTEYLLRPREFIVTVSWSLGKTR